MRIGALLLLLVGSSVAGNMSARLPGLILLWHLDEGSGTKTYDHSNNGRGGTFNGASAWVTGFQSFGSVHPTNTAYVQSGSVMTFDAFTMTAWVNFPPRPAALGVGYPITVSNNTSVGPFWISLGGPGYATFPCAIDQTVTGSTYTIIEGGNGGALVNRSCISVNGTWQHIAFTHTGGTSGVSCWYINGKNLHACSVMNLANAANTILTLGGINTYSGPEWIGAKMDEVSFFNRALSPGEVSSIYRNGVGRNNAR